MSSTPLAVAHQQWWRSAVIYQIYIRSFADGNGDGIGDIAGIRARLDHIAGLGVDAIWITPWYPSPMADGGYDVADYRDIAPEFGTLAESEQLIAEAHEHGLRVILDIVPNHTSDQHPWFRQALAGGPERDRYWFRPGRGRTGELPPNDWESVFGGSAWTRVEDGTWYLHLFAPEQPDLNWTSPDVGDEFEQILRFWFDRGIDGFRIDVAHGLAKDAELPNVGTEREELLATPDRDNHPHWDRNEVHEIYRRWRSVADSYADTPLGPRVFVAEAWVHTDPQRLARYVRSDELHTAFNFDLLLCPWDAAQFREVIQTNLDKLAHVDAPTTWVLSNHDVVRHATRYGRPAGQENERAKPVDSDLEQGLRRARAAIVLLLALPGSVYVYQGEELGLPEVEDLPEEVLQDPIWERSNHQVRGRDGCRVPLPWAAGEPGYGFGGAHPWLPQPQSWKEYAVQVQLDDPTSMLMLYRTAIHLRRDLPALRSEQLSWLDLAPHVVAFTRGDGFACVVNFGSEQVPLPEHDDILLASGPVEGGVLLPETAVWLGHHGPRG